MFLVFRASFLVGLSCCVVGFFLWVFVAFAGSLVFCCLFGRVVVLSGWFLPMGVCCFFGLLCIVLQLSFFGSLLVWYAVDVLDVLLAGLSCPGIRSYSSGCSLLLPPMWVPLVCLKLLFHGFFIVDVWFRPGY